MRDIINRFFGKGKNSREDAKQRLKFLLIHDQVDLSPGQLEKMKAEIIEVISRYVEVDGTDTDFRLEKGEGHVALVSSIPVRRVVEREARSAG